ncbi:TonB-dependent receptor [Permianibacter sp. IMCC34836]|uniref:TonB-dependent receptor n=1 Tax=Permianibacter fluminis TaxID=2738515 RepID=UPI0015547BFD|nr:TonB-dependent receptor [Permianibacter fluminis]NQD36723.1 TonB-dependent receptor [Permianibacter fluminis]
MKSTLWRKRVLAIAVSAVLTGTAGVAIADIAAGSIFGHTRAGGKVAIQSLDSGLKREIEADADGRYSFPQLQSGRYKITSGDETHEVVVSTGTGTSVNFGADENVLTVSGSRISPIDTSSVESNTVFSSQQLERLTVERDITDVALLAPGTTKGDTGFGNLASFGGASVAENGYYINGFDVTNIRNFVSYATLPFDAIAEQQIKTGGYGAEYGRSLGGVVSLVTKRGTNEWQGGASVVWEPESLREHSSNVRSRDPDQDESSKYFVYREDNKVDDLSYNIYGGGPIVSDRLFVFALVEGRDESVDSYGNDTSTSTSNRSPNYLLKLDWNITDDHLLELTAIDNEQETDRRFYRNPTDGAGVPIEFYTGHHGNLEKSSTIRDGGNLWVAKYTGYLTSDLTLSASYGKLKHTDNFEFNKTIYTDSGSVSSCPTIYDSRADRNSVIYLGCWDEDNFALARDESFGKDTDERVAKRLDLEWQLGEHQIRFGIDEEKFTSGAAGQAYEGGGYYRLFTVTEAGGRVVRGVTLPTGTEYYRLRTRQTSSGTYEVENSALYLEDSWQINDVLLYAGLRSESFDNKNGDGVSFVDASNLIAPRLGASWDVNGDGSLKVFTTLGRYYIPVASNSNIRASGAEYSNEQFFTYDGVIDPANGQPSAGTPIAPMTENGSLPLTAPDPSTVASTDLEPMFQDELIIGLQMQMADNWTVGARGIYREVKNGMDDYCSHQGFADWATDHGYTNFDTASMAQCVIINPGQDVTINMDLENDGNFSEVTVSNSYLGLPDYERTYKAVELFWERSGGDGWFLQGSYTWAKSEGNMEGYVNSTLEQDDAGLTQDFDHALFTDGSNGYLPNDRRHTVKVFGAYELTPQLSLSGNFLAQSGRPVSCNGYVPEGFSGEDDSSLQGYGASSFYCVKDPLVDANGDDIYDSELTHRGSEGRTPWVYRFDLGVKYTPDWADDKLSLKLDIFNVFNWQHVTEYNETHDRKVAGALEVNPNYLNDVNYQSPRSVLITARYKF